MNRINIQRIPIIVAKHLAYILAMICIFIVTLFLATLIYNLIEAYAFDTNNHTDMLYYVQMALFFFLQQFIAIYHLWGIPIIAAQLLCLYWLVQRKWSFIILLPILATSQIIFTFLSYVVNFDSGGKLNLDFYWPRLRAFLLAILVVSVIWVASRWLQKMLYRIRSSAHPEMPRMETSCRDNGRKIESIFSVVFLIGVFSYLYMYWLPNEQLQNPEWTSGVPISETSRQKARKICYKVLSHRLGNHHDAFGGLGEVGNTESIPYLISALKWQPPPDKEGLMDCTTGHCLYALRRLSGHNAGSKYEDWKRWWDETGSKLPPSSFPTEQGVAKAKNDIARGTMQIMWIYSAWPAGKPLVDACSGLPIQVTVQSNRTLALVQETEAYNMTMRDAAKQKK